MISTDCVDNKKVQELFHGESDLQDDTMTTQVTIEQFPVDLWRDAS